MLIPESAAYTGQEQPVGYSDFLAEANFYLAVEIEEGIDVALGKSTLDKIRQDLRLLSIQNLASFEQFISQIITKYNLPPSLTLSAGYLKGSIVYLKTVGQGKIYLKRRDNLSQIIGQDKSASGYLEPGDFFVFTTQKFITLIGSDPELKSFIAAESPIEIVDKIKSVLSDKVEGAVAALFVRFNDDRIEDAVILEDAKPEGKSQWAEIKNKGKDFLATFQSYSERSGKKKIFTLAAVVVIFLILIWSVVLGVQRRNISAINRKITLTRESVEMKLKQAEEGAFLNMSRTMVLLSEANGEVNNLGNEIGDDRKEVKELKNLIKISESKIVKKEEKNYEEFYDLTLDSQGAKGSNLYLEDANLSITDRGKGIVYILSLTKKSLNKKSAVEVKQTDDLVTYNDELFVYLSGKGIYKIGVTGKAEKVVENDKDWGVINDIWNYNGNLYLLDSGKGDIYKYIAAEKGFSKKSSYLGGSVGIVQGANSLAIDSSVYIGLADEIIKYTAGAKDDFSTSWPEKDIDLTKIFTSAEVEKVYAWSKAKGAVYILGKNGSYERQINASILTKASDFVVFNETVYLLSGEKIFKIDIK